MLPITSLTAVVAFAFDPIATVGPWTVRLETLGNAAAIFLALVATAVIAGRTPIDLSRPIAAGDGADGAPREPNHLRRDDLLYIAVAAIPGAFVGGRLGYALTHLDRLAPNPGVMLDIGWGGLQLSLAVVGGFLTASVVAGLLGAPLGRWMHAAILPLLFALGAGKLAMALGGSGQGELFDGGWATAYLGPGPWGSLLPQVPAHPAQLYESLATLAVLVILLAATAAGAFRGRSGGAFLVGIGSWAIVRLAVAFTWRDPAVLGPLRMDQLLSIAIAIVAFAAYASTSTVARRGGQDPPDGPGAGAVSEPDTDEPEPFRPFGT